MGAITMERNGAVATVTLNRPESLNTITHDMLSELAGKLGDCDQNPDIRVVIITGAGRAFCAGLDLKDAASEQGLSRSGFDLNAKLDLKNFPTTVLHGMDTPTICALNGSAAGFGMDLALGCDIRIAAEGAKMATAFTRRGIVPESGGTWLLPRMIGWSRACDIVFRAKTLDAQSCLALGLVNEVVAADQLVASSRDIAADIAASAPLAVQAAKQLMRAGLTEGFETHTERVYLQAKLLLGSEDFREGYTAFLEKRPPRFSGH